MTDAGRSGAALRSSYTGSTNVPRRLSYASVVTGAPTNTGAHALTSGTQPQHATMSQANSSYPPHYYAQPGSREHEWVSHGGTAHHRSLSSSSAIHSRGVSISPFWVPSYLAKTRYATKLESVYNARVRVLRDQDIAGSTSVWTRPSNARIAPSHRGMTYDIIESNPPPGDDIMPLPTRFSNTDKHQGLDILEEGLTVRYNGPTGKDFEAASIRSDHPMPPQCGIYYFEIFIEKKSKDSAVAIGFSTSDFSLERLPGWEPKSWAYHGDDGKAFEGQTNGQTFTHGFGEGHTVGCGVDFNQRHAFFTRDGRDLGIAFRDIKFPANPVFPCIGMKKHSGVTVKVNFGQLPFTYDIQSRMASEERVVARQIADTNTSTIHRGHSTEATFTQELIAQFLSHGGYIETARAFAQQVDKEREILYGDEHPEHPSMQSSDSFDARPRQQIRQAILSGDIDGALGLAEEHFHGVLDAHPVILFQLKCRKFIELVLKAARIDKARDTLRRRRQHNNGAAPHMLAVGDALDHAMELDDDQQTVFNGTGKAPVTNDEYEQLTRDALQYGKSLKEEYGARGDAEQDKAIREIFSLMAYYDPSPSQNGHLLDHSGRTKAAEDLNAAILASLGRSPTAAIETVCRQTEALLETLSLDGGPASLVNLERDGRER